MSFTDVFIKRPVYAIVISAFIFVLGLKAMDSLPIQQYPSIESAVITIQTSFTGADPATIAAFVTTPLEAAIAKANGINYMTSSSAANISMIQANLLLNYDPDKTLTEINTQISGVLNQLPKGSQIPALNISVASSIDDMYIGFNSKTLPANKITDYLLRVMQPKLQSITGVQQIQVLGQMQYALRAWLNPINMAGYGVTPAEVAKVLTDNDFVTAAGRTDGQIFVVNFTANTAKQKVKQFENLVIKAKDGAIVRLKDIAHVQMGAQNYNLTASMDGSSAVFLGLQVAPGANVLDVLKKVRDTFTDMKNSMPPGLEGKVVYDSSAFINSSIHEVLKTLLEAFLIVAVVVYIFLGSLRSLFIPLIAIPLSIIGTFFMMMMLGYTINILTLLALVLAIGLVVDDAIIVVENVCRHMEDGVAPLQASLMSAKELTKPIVAISVVLIAVYLPVGFMGGLTGALFTEFAFTLASSVGISAIIALTLSPMMCSRLFKVGQESGKLKLMRWFDRFFDWLRVVYEKGLKGGLKSLPVVMVFAVIILCSNYFLFTTSKSELAPQEDMGIMMAMLSMEGNAALGQTALNSEQVSKAFSEYPETIDTFQFNGTSSSNSAPTLNNAMGGMVLKPWDQRTRTTNQMQPGLQKKLNQIAGAKIAVFQLPSLPGGGAGLPVQFVIQTSGTFPELNQVKNNFVKAAYATGDFAYIDPDLKMDQLQTTIDLNENKISQMGLSLKDVGNSISGSLSQNYINYFNFMGRSYQVIPQMIRNQRLNQNQLNQYYIKTAEGNSIPLSTVAKFKQSVVPESINHFQQLNSTTISAVPAAGITMGQALAAMQKVAKETLPKSYSVDYAGQSRQFVQESGGLVATFGLALIIIYLALAVLFNSFRDPLIVLISVPMSICGAMIFISLSVGGATLNIYTEVGLITLIGLISKHGILIVEFANDLQKEGYSKFEAAFKSAGIRFRPILMTTAAMVFGVIPLILATGAGAVSRFNIGLVIATGISIGTCFTLFVVPAMYVLIGENHTKKIKRQNNSKKRRQPK